LYWTNGEQESMPVIFQPFYNWELVEELIKEYVR